MSNHDEYMVREQQRDEIISSYSNKHLHTYSGHPVVTH